jgi:hypothetical protein
MFTMELRWSVEPAITTPDQFKLIGQEVERIDTTLKSPGAALRYRHPPAA